jgi:hypothetical protein
MPQSRNYDLFALVLLACVAQSVRAQEVPLDPGAVRAAVLAETNAYRASKNIPQLQENAALHALAVFGPLASKSAGMLAAEWPISGTHIRDASEVEIIKHTKKEASNRQPCPSRRRPFFGFQVTPDFHETRTDESDPKQLSVGSDTP